MDASNKPISACVVTYNSAEPIIELLQSMHDRLDLSQVATYVVDNASTDDTAARVEGAYPWAELLRNAENLGFGAAHNQMLALLASTYHVVLNPDIVFLENSLSQMAAYLDANPDVVMVTPRILNRDGSEQHLPKRLPTPRHLLARRLAPKSARSQQLNREYTRSDEDFSTPSEIEHATGSIFMIRTAAFRNLGGFDEDFFLYFEDNDFSKRAAALGQIIFYPDTAVVHGYARASTHHPQALAHLLRSAVRYFKKHGWN